MRNLNRQVRLAGKSGTIALFAVKQPTAAQIGLTLILASLGIVETAPMKVRMTGARNCAVNLVFILSSSSMIELEQESGHHAE